MSKTDDQDDADIVSQINAAIRQTPTTRRTYLGGVMGTVAASAVGAQPAAASDHETGYGEGGYGAGGYGGSGSTDEPTPPEGGHVLTLVGNGEEMAYYTFTVDGDVTIEKSTEYGGTINSYDTITGTTVSARTTAEPDSYLLGPGAELTSFSAYGPIEILVDGRDVGHRVFDEIDGTDGEMEEAVEDDDQEQEEPEDEEMDTSDERVQESEYKSVVNIADEGADTSGSESITPILDDVVDDDTLVRFPEGTYRMDSGVRVTHYQNLGLVGRDATIISHATGDQTLFKLGTYLDPNERVHVEGFTADISRPNVGGRVFEVHATDELTVLDVSITGEHDSDGKGPLLVGLQDSSGEGLVENYSAPDGGVDQSGGNGGTGLLVSNYQTGTVTIRNPHIGPFPDNGIYCSNGTPPNSRDGTVHVRGGLVENANVAGVRLAGNNSSISGTEFVYDEDIPGFDGQRPIRLDWGEDLLVENISIDMSGVDSTEAIRVMPGVDSATIRNVSGRVGDRVRDLVSITEGAGPVETSDLDIVGFARYLVFDY